MASISQCSSCAQKPGIFSLQDTLCSACVSRFAAQKRSKFGKVMDHAPFSLLLFALVAGLQAYYHQVNNVILLVLLLLNLAACFVLRFFLIRRQSGKAAAAMLNLPVLLLISSVLSIGQGLGQRVIVLTLLALWLPYYILRLPNDVGQSKQDA